MSRYSFSLICFCIVFSSLSFAQTDFEDISEEVGLEYIDSVSARAGGVSFYDFNQDGFDDISLGTGSGDSILFFLSNGCSFYKIPSLVGNTGNQKQILWVDVDNDGDKDLFISSFDRGVRMYENQGSLNLVDVTLNAGLDTSNISAFGANFGDYNNDGYLDLYLNTLFIGQGNSNRLYRNNGNMTFTDVTAVAGLFDTTSLSFVSCFIDYNNDGWPDIYSTRDKVIHANKLYKNNANGTFSDVSVTSNSNISTKSMSATLEDYNADGFADIYVTNTQAGNTLLVNLGAGGFADTAAGSGVSVNSFSWSANFLDGDNDGDLDLFVATEENGQNSVSSSFYQNSASSFTRLSIPGMADDSAASYSSAIGDFNNDGMTDIVVSNLFEPAFFWKNQSSSGNYLKVLLQGENSNTDAIGSVVSVFTGGIRQYRHVLCGEGFIAQNSQYEIFGLGSYGQVDSLSVLWPNGNLSMFYSIPANNTIRIIENSGTSALSIAAIGNIKPCFGDSVKLISSPSFDHFSWSTGDTSSTIYTDSSGIYTLNANNNGSPINTAQIQISFNTLSNINPVEDTIICPGEEVFIQSSIQGCYLWSDSSTENSILITNQGPYHLKLESYGCTFHDSFNIQLFNTPEIFLGNDTILCADDSIILIVEGKWSSYYWSDNSTDSFLIVKQSGTYFLDATDSNSCISSDEIIIHFTNCTSVEEIYNNRDPHVYPNPSNGLLNIELNEKNEYLLEISIYDMMGKEVQKIKYREKERKDDLVLDELRKAQYVILIITSARTYRKMFIHKN